MFKKRCPHCDKKVEKSFDFCPHCSLALRNPQDYGFLGKNDEDEFDNILRKQQSQSNFSGLSGGLFNNNLFGKAMESAVKMLESEIRNASNQERKIEKQERNEQINPMINGGFQLFINGKKVNLPSNMALPLNMGQPQRTNEIKKQDVPEISEETLKKSLKLPRKEAKSKLTRLKNKVFYELDTPGLNSVSNVIVNKLENAIEVKAFTDKVVFYKTLAVKLQLIQYTLNPKEGKLILEFKAQ